MSRPRLIGLLALVAYLTVAGVMHVEAGGFGPAQGSGGGGGTDTLGDLTPTDGNFAVGNGTAWVAESGATARTSLGLGTGNTPTFAGVVTGNGTAGAPAVTGADTDSGVYFGTNTVGIGVAGFSGLSLTSSAATWGVAHNFNTASISNYTYLTAANTADANVAASGLGQVRHNTGAAGAVNLTSTQSAAAGQWLQLEVVEAQYLRFTAEASDLIRGDLTGGGGAITTSASGGYIRSNVAGSTVTLRAISATTWTIVAITGTWTIDS